MRQVRPYLHLDDAVRAVWFALGRAPLEGGTYNVLTENASIERIVGILKKFVPTLEVSLVSSPIMNQLSFAVSADRFTNLGFSYAASLEDGIARSVALLAGVMPEPA
jgi:nucleoside-diphosphate-sugar epimerase